MFTGLIEEVGEIAELQGGTRGGSLVLRCPGMAPELVLGESVAVNGICLTVTRMAGGRCWMDFSESTCQVTTLGGWRAGRKVNLERALKLGDRLGGHLVTGHVDAVGKLLARDPVGQGVRLAFSLPGSLCRQIVVKGSVAVDGTSLTINEAEGETFSVTIIPHTAERTTLLSLLPGDAVNVETDLLGKYVERMLGGYLPARPAGLTMERLVDSGF